MRAKPSTDNVVHLLTEPVQVSGYLAFVLPRAEEDLASFMSKELPGSVSASKLRSNFFCLANALSFIHGTSIIHGDLKPENVLVFKEPNNDLPTFKIADFGHSVLDDKAHKGGKLAAGTSAYSLNPGYSAPEVWQRQRSVTDLYACDVWALGCILLELNIFLTVGLLGLERLKASKVGLINGIVTETFHDGLRLKPGIETEARNAEDLTPTLKIFPALHKMLAKEPFDRPTAAEAETSLKFESIKYWLSTQFERLVSVIPRVAIYTLICCKSQYT
jgi:serine/threonine protein kinase